MLETLSILGCQVVSYGLEIANNISVMIKNGFYNVKNHQKPSSTDIVEEIITTTATIEDAIKDSTAQIIEKIEKDELERLYSRTKNIRIGLKISSGESILNYALQLIESVDYARNRFFEGKKMWFIPYISGLSMSYVVFSYIGKGNENVEDEFSTIIENMRNYVLNEIVTKCVKKGMQIPWNSIHQVLDNESVVFDELLQLIENNIQTPSHHKVYLLLAGYKQYQSISNDENTAACKICNKIEKKNNMYKLINSVTEEYSHKACIKKENPKDFREFEKLHAIKSHEKCIVCQESIFDGIILRSVINETSYYHERCFQKFTAFLYSK